MDRCAQKQPNSATVIWVFVAVAIFVATSLLFVIALVGRSGMLEACALPKDSAQGREVYCWRRLTWGEHCRAFSDGFC